MTKRLLILSASAISALKACPMKYRNAYILGIRPAEGVEPLRVGSSWHEGQEILGLKPEQPCPRCSNKGKPESTCSLCQGTGYIDDPIDALVRVLNQRYSDLFPGLSKETKEVERSMILHALFAYRYHYDNQPIETITMEMPFRIPLIDPRTHRAVPNVVIDGKLDKLIRWLNSVAVMEHKSTNDDLAPESDYWGHLKLDTQTNIYIYAAQRLQVDGLLEPWKIRADDPPISEILYDVWRKPTIRPKKLSQAETAQFIATNKYFDQEFGITVDREADEKPGTVSIDGEYVETEHLKSGAPVIRETPGMYGARLFNEIDGQPDRYFARRVLVRNSLEVERFERELFDLYRSIETHIEDDSWYHNEHSCDSYGRCDYCRFCFSGQEIDPKHPPAGFINIFDKGTK
jgi:hypothetical protein